jgi:PhzF family phenazine biosynthesis protein
MKLKIFQVDAFAEAVFSGNPAAVCPLEKWLSDDLMQNIARENNLSETAFFVAGDAGFAIRWFTPGTEVDLCGHATLAAAYVIFNLMDYPDNVIEFESRNSGTLKVSRVGHELTLDFPADEPTATELTQDLLDCFELFPVSALKGKDDYLLVFTGQEQIEQLKPDLDAITRLNARGLIVTAPGDEVDFVSRFFAPQSGVNEDPVTGSAHTTLTPYWAEQLGKNKLTARQLSQRPGNLRCTLKRDRVAISGEARLYLKGEIYVER